MTATPSSRDVVLHVARSEILRLLRDRKAVFFALILPLLLYPLLFVGMRELEQVSEQRMDEQRVAFAADLEALPDGLRQDFVERLPPPDGETVDWVELELDELLNLEGEAAGERAEELLEEHEADLLLVGAAGEPPVLVAFYRRDAESGMRAAQLVAGAARGLATELFETRLVEVLGRDPARDFEAGAEDVASVEDSAGLALGKLLPLIAVLVVLSGGAFAALEAFAAEREVGTLETLLVQPVARIDIARGKLVSILVVALAAWAGNAGSLIACASAGLLGGLDEGLTNVPVAALLVRVGLGTLLFLPTVALIGSTLGVLSAKARSYREGQNYILPLTFTGMALAAPAAAGDVVLDPLLALVPVLGPSLAMRDAVAGSLAPLPAALAVGSSIAYALLALRGIANTLDAERLLQGADVDAEAGARHLHARRALLWGAGGVGAIVLVGSWLQTRDLFWGLLATLWIVALGLGLLAGRDLGRRMGESVPKVLGLSAPPPLLAIFGALIAGPGLSKLMLALGEQQQRFLPMPELDAGALEELFGALLDRPLYVGLFVVALSPAICEEVLFRGAVLRGLRHDLSAAKAVVWQAVLFGLAHASIYRFLPTALLGLLLGVLRLRTGSLWPCVALHLSYNGSTVLAADDGGGYGQLLGHPAWFAAAAVGLALALLPRR